MTAATNYFRKKKKKPSVFVFEQKVVARKDIRQRVPRDTIPSPALKKNHKIFMTKNTCLFKTFSMKPL